MLLTVQSRNLEPALANSRTNSYQKVVRVGVIQLLLVASAPILGFGQASNQQGQNGNGFVYALPRVAVAPGTGQNGLNGAQGGGGQGTYGGISGVTIPTRTADRQVLVSQFFAAGGVNLVDTNALPSATGRGGGTAVIAGTGGAAAKSVVASAPASGKQLSPAKLDTADGLYALGMQRLSGDGVPTDTKAARALLAAAAQKGSVAAKTKLAELDASRRATR